MGRKKKYDKKVETISISLDGDVLDKIESKSKKVDLSRSEYINRILEHFAYGDKEFCSMMAKKAAQDLYYWKSRAEAEDMEIVPTMKVKI